MPVLDPARVAGPATPTVKSTKAGHIAPAFARGRRERDDAPLPLSTLSWGDSHLLEGLMLGCEGSNGRATEGDILLRQKPGAPQRRVRDNLTDPDPTPCRQPAMKAP